MYTCRSVQIKAEVAFDGLLCSTYASINITILRPTTPLPGGVGEEVGFEVCKSQMNQLLGKPVQQSNSNLPPPKRWGFTRGFACYRLHSCTIDTIDYVTMHVHAYGERSNSPCSYRARFSVKCPTSAFPNLGGG